MSDTKVVVEGIVAGIFAVWLGWISWEVVNTKSDHNVEDRIHSAVLELTKAIGTVSGNLNIEIERSRIIDNRQRGWLKFINDTALENKGRIIIIETKESIHHGN